MGIVKQESERDLRTFSSEQSLYVCMVFDYVVGQIRHFGRFFEGYMRDNVDVLAHKDLAFAMSEISLNHQRDGPPTAGFEWFSPL